VSESALVDRSWMQDAETSASAKAVLLFSLVGIAVSALFLLSSADETMLW
jgi:hypothetical protein